MRPLDGFPCAQRKRLPECAERQVKADFVIFFSTDDNFHPIALLAAIRDWVGAFFACEHCRHHFLKMTTRTARIESMVL